jgi:glycerol uptake facilitator protein
MKEVVKGWANEKRQIPRTHPLFGTFLHGAGTSFRVIVRVTDRRPGWKRFTGMGLRTSSLGARCLAEGLGTFVLVFFGCGAVHAAVLTSAQSGLWQVAIVWGVAIMVAVYVFGAISGAHINPAITVALAAWGRASWQQVLPYVLSQVAGAFVAAAALFGLFHSQLAAKESEKNVARSQWGSEITAMCYGEYFPSPAAATAEGPYRNADHEALSGQVSHATAFFAEVLGTLLLALAVFALTDGRNPGAPPGYLAPVFIGLTVAILISVIAPLTQACFNPARDFGPRLFAYLAGWGKVAIPGPNGIGFLTVYVLAPIVGAGAGGGLYERVIRPTLPVPEEQERKTPG